jgi:ribonuclease-3
MIFLDNGIDGTLWSEIKYRQVIAKPRATSKREAEKKHPQRTYFAFQEKMDKK